MLNSAEPSDNAVDGEELFRLAVLDMKQNRHEEAIARLKRLIVLEPGNAGAYCLLGAEHAELGMFERAAPELEKAISLDPKLAVAHFQLGLIHYLRNDAATAERYWQRLNGLPESEGLESFSRALLLAARGATEDALTMIDRALTTKPSEALARDMNRIRSSLVAQRRNPGAGPAGAPQKADSQHALLSNYSALSIAPDDPERKH